MHYKIGVICVYIGHVLYTLLQYYDSIIHLFHNSTVRVKKSPISGQCLYTIRAETRKCLLFCLSLNYFIRYSIHGVMFLLEQNRTKRYISLVERVHLFQLTKRISILNQRQFFITRYIQMTASWRPYGNWAVKSLIISYVLLSPSFIWQRLYKVTSHFPVCFNRTLKSHYPFLTTVIHITKLTRLITFLVHLISWSTTQS